MGKKTRFADKRMLDKLHTIRTKYPDTWRLVRRMALRTGKKISLILNAFNFSDLMRAEDERRLPLFRRMMASLLRFVDKRRTAIPTKKGREKMIQRDQRFREKYAKERAAAIAASTPHPRPEGA